jgi:hypothetical protein
MKKLFVFLTTVLCLCANGNKATAQTVPDDITGDVWELTGAGTNYTLTISGSGAMANYSFNNVPWSSDRNNIKALSIQQGVTAIGHYAFSYYLNITIILTIPITD